MVWYAKKHSFPLLTTQLRSWFYVTRNESRCKAPAPSNAPPTRPARGSFSYFRFIPCAEAEAEAPGNMLEEGLETKGVEAVM